jgi:hypothetical protein
MLYDWLMMPTKGLERKGSRPNSGIICPDGLRKMNKHHLRTMFCQESNPEPQKRTTLIFVTRHLEISELDRKLTGGSRKIIQEFNKKYIMKGSKILVKIYGVISCDA